MLENDVSERAITHKLAEYIQEQFPDWNVDCEYNRDGHDPKRVNLINGPDKVYPDIIVHKRGPNGPNLMVVEVKKSNDTRQNGEEHDRQKLNAYLQGLSYKVGVLVVFNIGKLGDTHYRCEYFVNKI
ncbi:MAG: hypothetical protein ACTSYF_10535 [Promethearchaeota archaeon]